MSVKLTLTLDSEKIGSDDMFSLQTFLGDISLTELLMINKMVADEMNERLDVISMKYFK